jgi:hypothetical protein
MLVPVCNGIEGKIVSIDLPANAEVKVLHPNPQPSTLNPKIDLVVAWQMLSEALQRHTDIDVESQVVLPRRASSCSSATQRA